MSTDAHVAKTYKLFIGGAFPRSESGRVRELRDPSGGFIANVAHASRKDARDAVVAARGAQAKWAKATAYNRGQVIYRIAEMLETRSAQFADALVRVHGVSAADARETVDLATTRLVWFAGAADKFASVWGGQNPVAGPYFNISSPEASGVAVVSVGASSDLVEFVDALVAPLVTGNAVVVLADTSAAVTAIDFAEVVATSDVPSGVVNILTADRAELLPWLAAHEDVDALDLSGAADLEWAAYDEAAAATLKRVVRPSKHALDGFDRISRFTEIKTVWHTQSLA